jgi:protein TonB
VAQHPPKQAQAASAVAEQATGQPSSGPIAWLPMALAPADKPIAKQPVARLSGAAYSSKVWSALARHKPRAGQKGSATVTFTIGAGGALSGARIGKSSGNAKIDQLALATVRGAAPFPPPPSGPASFSIRIDFH